MEHKLGILIIWVINLSMNTSKPKLFPEFGDSEPLFIP